MSKWKLNILILVVFGAVSGCQTQKPAPDPYEGSIIIGEIPSAEQVAPAKSEIIYLEKS